MKKLLAICSVCVFSLSLFAQPAGHTEKIIAANQVAFQCSFTQSKHLKVVKAPIESSGTLYVDGSRMAMIYSRPEGDFLRITEQAFVMQSQGKRINHNLKAGSAMLALRNTLLHCMHGEIPAIAKETDSNIAFEETATAYAYTLTSKKKVARGYQKIVLGFDKKTLQLTQMGMYEPNGNYTEYLLSSTRQTLSNDKVFTIPQ